MILNILLLSSCNQGDLPTQDDLTKIEISDAEFHEKLLSGLNVDTYKLEGPPSTEPLVFVPVSGYSQEQILTIHEEDRKLQFSDNIFFDEMNFGMKTEFDDRMLIAREEHTISTEADPGSPASVVIEVMLDDEVIYSTDAGDMSPLTPLQGLWSYNQNWVLEYANVTITYSETENP
jgi:hypothetical protein